MKICMVGVGYVGLVSGACFSEFGWNVICIDKDPDRIAKLQKGEIPIYEPGLDDLVARNKNSGRLQFTTNLPGAVAHADVIFLAVGTPMRRGDGHADLSFIFSALEQMAPHLNGFKVIVTKSTVPVGTGEKIQERLRTLRPDLDFAICSNPEFLREGSAIYDFMHPDRIVVGCDDPRAEEVLRKVYKTLTLRDAPIIFTDRESAELAKYASNAFLAMKISFINQIADLCENVGADVHQVAMAIGRDRRIGDKFLHPGPGYGGSCFPKDVSALIRTGREHGSPMTIIENVQHVNEERKIDMVRRIRSSLGGSLRDKVIGVLGVTFKPETDDLREAPSLTILSVLVEEGARAQVFDPKANRDADDLLKKVSWCNHPLDVAKSADAVVIVTEWNEFRGLDLKEMRMRMRGNLLLDLRNIYNPTEALDAGLDYRSVGRSQKRISPRKANAA